MSEGLRYTGQTARNGIQLTVFGRRRSSSRSPTTSTAHPAENCRASEAL
jgi:hypothetical protein